jgi:hypothetical protein
MPPRDVAERDRFGMTGRGYEEVDPDDYDRPVNLGGQGSPPPGPLGRVGFDPNSQRHGDYGDYGDYGDELGTTTPMRAFYEGQLSSVGGGPAPRGRRGRGWGAYEGGEPRHRSGTDAVDYDRGGSWGGRSMMCTSDREFTIRGVEDCLARGFDRNGFKEVDTGTLPSWTIQLIDPERTGAALR